MQKTNTPSFVEPKITKVVKKCNKEPRFIGCLSITQCSQGIVVPLEATFMKIILVGAGGAGGDYKLGDRIGGGGGGGGATYLNNNFAVTSGDTFNITIGAGGMSEGKNGGNGDDTILQYDCTTKCAKGGKGGDYSTFGGNGGRGGEGGKNSKPGDNGGNGNFYGGGEGGRTQVSSTFGQVYGVGGNGGFNSTVALPDISLSSHNIELKESNFPSILTHLQLLRSVSKGDTCRSKYNNCTYEYNESKIKECDYDYRPVNLITPTVNPIGNPGVQGYAEIEFYSLAPSSCKKEDKFLKVQNITDTLDNVIHYLDSNADLIVIDTSTQVVNAYLGKPIEAGNKITIKLLYQKGSAAHITLFCGGTFTLSSANSSVTLVFTGCAWHVQGTVSLYPTTQQGLTIPLFGGPFTEIATSKLAISANGNTVVVGQPYNNQNFGSVTVYVRCSGMWKLQATLVNTDYSDPNLQGFSIALSADGNTLAFGAPLDNNGEGAVFVFIRKCDVWTQQGPKLVSTDSSGFDLNGFAIALNADGNTLVVGAPNYGLVGSIVIFRRNMDIWSQNSRIMGNPGDNLGTLLKLSANGTTLVATNGSSPSTISIYILKVDIWELQSVIILTNIIIPLTDSLALSASGDILAIGTPLTLTNSTGTVSVYKRSNTSIWTLNSTLHGSNINTSESQIVSVSLSANGNTIALGGLSSVWIFSRVDENWIERKKLSDNIGFGTAVALSSEGSTLAVANGFTSENPHLYIFV